MSKRETTSQPGIFRYQTKAGTRYRVVVDGRPDALTGKRVQRTRSGLRTLAEAKAARAALLGDGGGPNWTVAELAKRWLAAVESSGRVRASSVAAYERRLRVHVLPGLGTARVREVTALRLEELYAAKRATGMQVNTLFGIHAPVTAMFSQAVKWGVIAVNPAAGVTMPAAPVAIGRSWTAAEARRFLAATEDEADGPFWRVMLTTGIRLGEAIGLRWDDLDLDKRTMRIERTMTRDRAGKRVIGDAPKTASSRRVVMLTAACVVALRRQREMVQARAGADSRWVEGGWVFPGRHGMRWNEQGPSVRLRQRCEEVGVPRLRIHDLRHTSATLARSAGGDAEVVARRLGHATVGQTSQYTHFGVEAQRTVVVGIAGALGERRDRSVTSVAAGRRVIAPKRAERRANSRSS